MPTTWTPSSEDYARVFAEQNPWHKTGEVPMVLAKETERHMAKFLSTRILDQSTRRYQLVLGPRRVGKTTVMYQVVRALLHRGVDRSRLWWLRLDHPLLVDWPLGDIVKRIMDLSNATEENPAFLFMDELVYTQRWDLWLKTFYDEHYPVKIVATSSASAALREGRLESGVGRWDERYLGPYVLGEYAELTGTSLPDFADASLTAALGKAFDPTNRIVDLANRRIELMFVGGFPEILLDSRDGTQEDITLNSQNVLRSDAVERAIYKDIPQSFKIESPLNLEKLLYVLAHQMTGIISPLNICRDLGFSQPTFDRYLSYLERAFLIFVLPNFAGNESTTQRRGRKVYFVDGAVRNAALQRGIGPLDDPREQGLLLENMAAAHLQTLATVAGVRLHHWRSGSREVDLIYNHPTEPLAFEISNSPSHSRSGMEALLEEYPRFSGATYLVAPGAPLVPAATSGSGIGSMPADVFLAVVGSQAAYALQQSFGGSG